MPATSRWSSSSTGFLDAGKSAELRCSAPRPTSAEGKVVATFDVDALHDYRARRPPMTFVRDHYTDYEAPRLVVRALRDTGGTPFLLLPAPSPTSAGRPSPAPSARSSSASA